MSKSLSYAEFKRRARAYQVDFREKELKVGYYKYPNVLNYADAQKLMKFMANN